MQVDVQVTCKFMRTRRSVNDLSKDTHNPILCVLLLKYASHCVS